MNKLNLSIPHWVKFLVGGVDKDDQKEVLFKRLKHIENKIKNEDKKEWELIKNEEQSEVLKDESTVADKKPKEIVC